MSLKMQSIHHPVVTLNLLPISVITEIILVSGLYPPYHITHNADFIKFFKSPLMNLS